MKTRIQELLEKAEYECRSYSGRGMNGKECLSVSTDMDVFGVIADMLENIPHLSQDEEDFADYCCDVELAVREIKTDQMGKGTVVYFPGIECVKEEEEEEENDSPNGDCLGAYGQ